MPLSSLCLLVHLTSEMPRRKQVPVVGQAVDIPLTGENLRITKAACALVFLLCFVCCLFCFRTPKVADLHMRQCRIISPRSPWKVEALEAVACFAFPWIECMHILNKPPNSGLLGSLRGCPDYLHNHCHDVANWLRPGQSRSQQTVPDFRPCGV